MFISRLDRVQAKLFSAPPWSDGEGRWQNGVFVKRLPPRILPSNKRRPLVGLGSLAVSLMMLGMFVRRYNARRNQ